MYFNTLCFLGVIKSKKQPEKSKRLKLPQNVIIINGSGSAADITVTGLSNGVAWNIQAKQPHSEKGVSQKGINTFVLDHIIYLFAG